MACPGMFRRSTRRGVNALLWGPILYQLVILRIFRKLYNLGQTLSIRYVTL